MLLKRVKVIGFLLLTGLACVVAQAASLSRSGIPTGSNWYLHANLELMQSSAVGLSLMHGTVAEALAEIEGELGIAIGDEIQGITLFGASLPVNGNAPRDGAVILHGAASAPTRAAVLAALQRKGAQLSSLDSAGLAYYRVADGDASMSYTDDQGQVRGVSWGNREALYFSFGARQTLLTHNMNTMQDFLDAGGILGGFENLDADALVVLQADRALLQDGANTATESAGDLDPSVLMNVDALALVIAEAPGGMQVSAQLTASSPENAANVRNIVEGLIALKAMEESDSALGEILRQVRFESNGALLHMQVPLRVDQIEVLRNL
jgi:hypothetical protein